MTIQFFAMILLAYLIGAIPFGFLIGKYHGRDIRREGSGNIGSTNVTRVIGKRAGQLCFVCDFVKGLLPVLAAWQLAPESELPLAVGAAAIVGHMYPLYLGFKGGKGVATAAGVGVALAPWALLTALAGWLIAFFATRIVSLASIVAAVMMPLTATVLYFSCGEPSVPIQLFFYAVGAVAILKHRSNIQRLLAGTEQKFVRSPRPGKEEK